MSKKGTNRIGKKQWAKARSIRLKKIGDAFGFVGIGMDAAGFIPYVGPVISISYPFYRDAMIDNVVIPAYEHLSE